MTGAGNPRFDFADRVVVVTGAASGIGAACATAFAAAGAQVAMVDLNGRALGEQAAKIDGVVSAHQLDIADDEAVDRALADIAARNGEFVDHLVNCAASFIAAGLQATRAEWERSLGVNVVASALLTSKVARSMPPGSSVVNVSSISAHAAQPVRWTYNATKAAILALTRGQALDLAPSGIRVNAVSPGWVWTPEVDKASQGDHETWGPIWGRYHILQRLGQPEEIADPILYLCSPGASFITGTELMVDGGYSAMGPEGLGETAQFAGSDARTAQS